MKRYGDYYMYKVVSCFDRLNFSSRILRDITYSFPSNYVFITFEEADEGAKYVIERDGMEVCSVSMSPLSSNLSEVSFVFTSEKYRRMGLSSGLMSYAVKDFFLDNPSVKLKVVNHSFGVMSRFYAQLAEAYDPYKGLSSSFYPCSGNLSGSFFLGSKA